MSARKPTPGGITVEIATVYRGGRRRWFSRRAAINAEARAVHRSHFRERCECSDAEAGPYGAPGETCYFHEPSYYSRFTRRVARLLDRALSKATENGRKDDL